jgi:DNA-binding SARP family transcriptional activator
LPTVPLAEPRHEAAAVFPIKKEQQGEQAPPSLVIYCLGPFRVYNNEQLIEKWPGHKCKSIFKYMIIHRKRPIHREILMDLFWRDADPEAARRNLYQAIYNLRQALQTGDPEFPYILCEDSCYRLNPELELWVDSEAFTLHYQAGQRLERESPLHEAIIAYELAENLYEGEFLVEDRYEDWSLVHRENLKHKYLDILDRLSQHYFDQGQLAMCIISCQKILTKDNCREDAYRRLMRCYLRQGQCHLALRQYHLCVETLEQELNVPPMPATIELYHEIQKSRVQFPGT